MWEDVTARVDQEYVGELVIVESQYLIERTVGLLCCAVECRHEKSSFKASIIFKIIIGISNGCQISRLHHFETQLTYLIKKENRFNNPFC